MSDNLQNNKQKQCMSEILPLDDLWIDISRCLLALEESKDEYTVLVLQPSVEAFFLIHASYDPPNNGSEGGNSNNSSSANESSSDPPTTSGKHSSLRRPYKLYKTLFTLTIILSTLFTFFFVNL